MSFTDLSQRPDVLQRVLQSLGLAVEGEEVRATALTGGVSSGIYRVRLRSGSYCVKQALPQLKVAKEWKVPVGRARYEYEWLRAAARIAPAHVPAVFGLDEATMSFAMEDLGDDHRSWKGELLAGRVDPQVAARLGAILAQIHAATAGQPDIATRFETLDNFQAIRLEPYLGESARVHPAHADQLLSLAARTAGNRLALVHGDVSPKNILVGPRQPVLLDAECAWYGDPAFDVAFCLNHFLLKAVHLPDHRAALMQCFDAFSTAYVGGIRWEAADALEARAASLLPGLLLARVDGKSPVEYLGEPQRDQVRVQALALLSRAPERLETLARHWTEAFPA